MQKQLPAQSLRRVPASPRLVARMSFDLGQSRLLHRQTNVVAMATGLAQEDHLSAAVFVAGMAKVRACLGWRNALTRPARCHLPMSSCVPVAAVTRSSPGSVWLCSGPPFACPIGQDGLAVRALEPCRSRVCHASDQTRHVRPVSRERKSCTKCKKNTFD